MTHPAILDKTLQKKESLIYTGVPPTPIWICQSFVQLI